MTRTLRALTLKVLPARQGEVGHVHFHQGPHALPAPCFDVNCPNPRLSLEGSANR